MLEDIDQTSHDKVVVVFFTIFHAQSHFKTLQPMKKLVQVYVTLYALYIYIHSKLCLVQL